MGNPSHSHSTAADGDSITGMQIRMARAALRWRATKLADMTELGWAWIQQLERHDDVPSAPVDVLGRVRKVFEDAGIRFVPGDSDTHGSVRVSRSRPAHEGEEA